MSIRLKNHHLREYTVYPIIKANDIIHAIETDCFTFLWYLPDSWCTILIKALLEEPVTLSETLILNLMHSLIRQPKQKNTFFQDWIVGFFIETLEEDEEEDDHT